MGVDLIKVGKLMEAVGELLYPMRNKFDLVLDDSHLFR
jgi:hypothetical protein